MNFEHVCKPVKYGKLSKFRFTMIRYMRHEIICKIPHINDHTFPLLPQELPIYWLTGFPTYQLQTRFSNCVSGRSEMSEWQLGFFPYVPLSTTPLYTRAVAMATWLSPSALPPTPIHLHSSLFLSGDLNWPLLWFCVLQSILTSSVKSSFLKHSTRCFCL